MFLKILLLLITLLTQLTYSLNSHNLSDSINNWLPLQVGNMWHYDLKSLYQVQGGSYWFTFLFNKITITDSINIDQKKYFLINGFFDFPSGTKIRYDTISSQIIILVNDSDKVFMDFTLPDGDSLLQINPNGTHSKVVIISGNIDFLGELITSKGYYKEQYVNYRYKEGYYYFLPGVGFINQYEQSSWWMVHLYSYKIIEYFLNDYPYEPIHLKHNFSANILFEPIYIINNFNLIQEFKIHHSLSVLSYPFVQSGRTYIDSVFFNSFYSNGIDTIFNSDQIIYALSEEYYKLNYEIDSNLFAQGFDLYYRIIAKDKGIIPNIFYKPDSGYYKLSWTDSSSTSINFEFSGKDYYLLQNYPNPFNPVTTIQYNIREQGLVSLKIYNLLGEEIANLVNEVKNSGNYEVKFNASGLSSGIYFYSLKVNNFIDSKKFILLK